MATAQSIAGLAEAGTLAAAPELGVPLLVAQSAPQIADVAKTAIPVVGDVTKTAIPVVGDVAIQATKSYQAVATEAIHTTPTILSLPLRFMGMSVGVMMIVIGVILVLISIAVISAQSSKTAGIMILIVGSLLSGAGGFMMSRAMHRGHGHSKAA